MHASYSSNSRRGSIPRRESSFILLIDLVINERREGRKSGENIRLRTRVHNSLYRKIRNHDRNWFANLHNGFERATSSTFRDVCLSPHPSTDNVHGGIGRRMEGETRLDVDPNRRRATMLSLRQTVAVEFTRGIRGDAAESCKWNISEPWCNRHGPIPFISRDSLLIFSSSMIKRPPRSESWIIHKSG